MEILLELLGIVAVNAHGASMELIVRIKSLA
jgi:hypothetical protein